MKNLLNNRNQVIGVNTIHEFTTYEWVVLNYIIDYENSQLVYIPHNEVYYEEMDVIDGVCEYISEWYNAYLHEEGVKFMEDLHEEELAAEVANVGLPRPTKSHMRQRIWEFK